MPKPTTPENNTSKSSREEYLADLLTHVEVEYRTLATKYNGLHSQDPENLNGRLDDMFAYVLGAKYAQAENLDLDDVLAQQTQAQAAILTFDNLRPVLSACLQTYLYKLSAENILPTSHGVIKGILEATKPYIPQIINLSYVECKDYAKAIYDKILAHTHGFATALPLPDVNPLSAEEIASILSKAILPFDLSAPLSKAIDDLRADVVTAYTEVLSVSPDISTLTLVTDNPIKRAAYLLIGRASTPYLMDGGLIIHDVTADKFYKVIPIIGVDNYATYGFRVYNYRNLYERIYQEQRIMGITADDDEYIEYEELPVGNPEARRKFIESLAERDKEFINLLTPAFADDEFVVESARAKAGYFKSVKYISYYSSVIFISSHKLAAYTYYPQEDSDFIIRTPIDPETGKPVKYHVHHVGGKGSENDNRRENLRIITKQLNDELRHTSRPVIYRDTRYNTLKAYCSDTKAGSLPALSQATANLTIGDQIIFKNRIYALDPETGDILASDDPQATRYVYNGIEYEDLKAFTDAQRLGRKSYDAIQKGIIRAKKADKTEYKHKRYKFYLGDSNIIEITST